MAATPQEATEIQVQVSGRRPQWVAQETSVAAGNGAPGPTSDGVSVTGASGRSCVDVALAVVATGASGVELRVWGYYPTLGVWCVLNGATYTVGDTSWTAIVRGGPVERMYMEVTAIGGGTVDLQIGPCDV